MAWSRFTPQDIACPLRLVFVWFLWLSPYSGVDSLVTGSPCCWLFLPFARERVRSLCLCGSQNHPNITPDSPRALCKQFSCCTFDVVSLGLFLIGSLFLFLALKESQVYRGHFEYFG